MKVCLFVCLLFFILFFFFFLAISKKSYFINARETAPWAAYRDMFNHTGMPSTNHSSYGVESIAVPGELAGYWHLYNRFGSKQISWKRLFQDAINFARNGFPVGEHLENALNQNRNTIMRLSQLREVYVNPNTNDVYKRGDNLRQPNLALTLEKLSEAVDPHDYFYNQLAKLILDDIYMNISAEFPGQTPIMVLSDFARYSVIEEEAYSVLLKSNLTLHTVKLPGAGQLLSFIIRVMLKYDDLYPDMARLDETKAILFFHRLIETFKYTFANRMYLGDDRFDNVTEVLRNITSDDYINQIVASIDDNRTYPASSGHYDSKV